MGLGRFYQVGSMSFGGGRGKMLLQFLCGI